LATNVAETSITVPGIRAVIDSGLARVSRYSARNRLQRLPIEPIARASADQRKGRCGRLGPGLCLRLYTEEDFAGRPAFTEPEVLRTNLAALLLRLAADGLGAAEEFPFLDAPDSRALNDGYRLLQELGALDAGRCITRQGRAMARLPLDPRLARALLESKRFRAERELLAIVAGLSVPDARITPSDETEDAPAAAAFEDARSEFSALDRLWRAYTLAREGPRRELRRWCKERRLSLLRLSEWDNVHAQVKDRAADIGIRAGPRAATYTAIHRSLLAGFCTMVGVRTDEGSYLGPRGVRFHIFPGSPLRRRKPRWLMAANIVETSRVYARRVAEIQPVWIETAAAHLLKREYLAPDWNGSRGEVVAQERISLLGLTLSADRFVNYGPIAPEESRHIFAREALVYQRLRQRPDWLVANDAAVAAAQRVEERLRTRDLLVKPERLVELYDKALPRQVSSAATLDVFSRRLSEDAKQALRFGAADVYARLPDPAALARFPEVARFDRLEVPIDYRFEPGEAHDGATLRLPLLALPGVTMRAVAAAIPGFALPRVEALLRSLPKDARRLLIPIGATAARYLAATAQASTEPPPLAAWLTAQCGVPAALVRFDPRAVPAHLTAALAVSEDGREIARGVDLAQLRRDTAAHAEAALERAARGLYPGDWRRFELEELPTQQHLPLSEGSVVVFPALARSGDRIDVRLCWSAPEAQRLGIQGAAYLARRCLARQARDLAQRLAGDSGLLLAASADSSSAALIDVLLQRTFQRACFPDAAPPTTRNAFDQALERGRGRLFDCLNDLSAEAAAWFAAARAVRRLLADPRARGLGGLATESQGHLQRLLGMALRAGAPAEWLQQLARYLKAEEQRWQRLLARGSEPPRIALELDAWTLRHASLEKALQAERRWLPQIDDLGGWIEEYRVSLVAQELKTVGPVSAARLSLRAAEIEAWLSR
jgi:ATP-dependent helicase HrpA